MKRRLITLGIVAAGIVGLDLWLRRQPKPKELPIHPEIIRLFERFPGDPTAKAAAEVQMAAIRDPGRLEGAP